MEKSKFKKIFGSINLLEGKPWKVIILFSISILISNFLASGLDLINVLILKKTVGTDSVTSMNCTSSISAILFNFAYGCTTGFSVILSNKFGAKDKDGMKKTFFNSIIISIILALTISIFGILLLKNMLNWLNIDEVYYDKAYKYFILVLISFVFTLLNNLMSNFLRAMGNSFTPLLFAFFTTLFDILVAFLLTGVIHLDVVGCGIAYLLTNFLGFLFNFIYIYKNYPYLRFTQDSLKLDKNEVTNLLKTGLPLGFQWSILFIGSFIQSSKVNTFGANATKANNCKTRENYLTIPLTSIASALLSFIGQNYGAKQYKRIKVCIKQTIIIEIILYTLSLIVGLVTIKYVPYIFLEEQYANDPNIYFYATTYLYFVVVSLIFQGLLLTFRSSLQGIKKTMIPFLSGIGELFARAFVCLFIPQLIDPTNPISNKAYIGLCFSTPFAWIVSFVIMGGFTIYFIFNKEFEEGKMKEIGEKNLIKYGYSTKPLYISLLIIFISIVLVVFISISLK